MTVVKVLFRLRALGSDGDYGCMHAGKTADDISMTYTLHYEIPSKRQGKKYIKTARQFVEYSGKNWSSEIASHLRCKMKKRAV